MSYGAFCFPILLLISTTQPPPTMVLLRVAVSILNDAVSQSSAHYTYRRFSPQNPKLRVENPITKSNPYVEVMKSVVVGCWVSEIDPVGLTT